MQASNNHELMEQYFPEDQSQISYICQQIQRHYQDSIRDDNIQMDEDALLQWWTRLMRKPISHNRQVFGLILWLFQKVDQKILSKSARIQIIKCSDGLNNSDLIKLLCAVVTSEGAQSGECLFADEIARRLTLKDLKCDFELALSNVKVIQSYKCFDAWMNGALFAYSHWETFNQLLSQKRSVNAKYAPFQYKLLVLLKSCINDVDSTSTLLYIFRIMSYGCSSVSMKRQIELRALVAGFLSYLCTGEQQSGLLQLPKVLSQCLRIVRCNGLSFKGDEVFIQSILKDSQDCMSDTAILIELMHIDGNLLCAEIVQNHVERGLQSDHVELTQLIVLILKYQCRIGKGVDFFTSCLQTITSSFLPVCENNVYRSSIFLQALVDHVKQMSIQLRQLLYSALHEKMVSLLNDVPLQLPNQIVRSEIVFGMCKWLITFGNGEELGHLNGSYKYMLEALKDSSLENQLEFDAARVMNVESGDEVDSEYWKRIAIQSLPYLRQLCPEVQMSVLRVIFVQFGKQLKCMDLWRFILRVPAQSLLQVLQMLEVDQLGAVLPYFPVHVFDNEFQYQLQQVCVKFLQQSLDNKEWNHIESAIKVLMNCRGPLDDQQILSTVFVEGVKLGRISTKVASQLLQQLKDNVDCQKQLFDVVLQVKDSDRRWHLLGHFAGTQSCDKVIVSLLVDSINANQLDLQQFKLFQKYYLKKISYRNKICDAASSHQYLFINRCMCTLASDSVSSEDLSQLFNAFNPQVSEHVILLQLTLQGLYRQSGKKEILEEALQNVQWEVYAQIYCISRSGQLDLSLKYDKCLELAYKVDQLDLRLFMKTLHVAISQDGGAFSGISVLEKSLNLIIARKSLLTQFQEVKTLAILLHKVLTVQNAYKILPQVICLMKPLFEHLHKAEKAQALALGTCILRLTKGLCQNASFIISMKQHAIPLIAFLTKMSQQVSNDEVASLVMKIQITLLGVIEDPQKEVIMVMLNSNGKFAFRRLCEKQSEIKQQYQ
ncbi:hypothetical protein MP228_006497 [Amoeboaphelidium protococcarum]|nr:hypothetical protein MP228_006497 [Amoeboaphelidium protococcarum]